MPEPAPPVLPPTPVVADAPACCVSIPLVTPLFGVTEPVLLEGPPPEPSPLVPPIEPPVAELPFVPPPVDPRPATGEFEPELVDPELPDLPPLAPPTPVVADEPACCVSDPLVIPLFGVDEGVPPEALPDVPPVLPVDPPGRNTGFVMLFVPEPPVVPVPLDLGPVTPARPLVGEPPCCVSTPLDTPPPTVGVVEPPEFPLTGELPVPDVLPAFPVDPIGCNPAFDMPVVPGPLVVPLPDVLPVLPVLPVDPTGCNPAFDMPVVPMPPVEPVPGLLPPLVAAPPVEPFGEPVAPEPALLPEPATVPVPPLPVPPLDPVLNPPVDPALVPPPTPAVVPPRPDPPPCAVPVPPLAGFPPPFPARDPELDPAPLWCCC